MSSIKKNVRIKVQAHRKTSVITLDEFSVLRKAYWLPLSNGVYLSHGYETIMRLFVIFTDLLKLGNMACLIQCSDN